jgi:flavin-dependent dehydrogenase
VIGAGAAGSVTALTASKFDLNVTILESKSNVGIKTGSKLDIIESIGVERIFKELKLPIIGKSNNSKWYSPNYDFELKSEICDFYIKRGLSDDSFDKINIEKSLDNGSKLITNSHPIKFEWKKNNNVKRVIAKNKGKKIEIEPKFIIGSDGVYSSVLRLSGLCKTEKNFGEFHAYGIFCQNLNLPIDVTHVFFDNDIAPGGYVFTASSNKNSILGIGLDPLLTDKTPKDFFQKIKCHSKISKILDKVKIQNDFYGIGKISLLRKRAIGNIMLVGDAGRFLDPFLGFGLNQAIQSGYFAARTCGDSINNIGDRDPSKEFELKISQLKNELKLSLFIRKVYRKINNSDIDLVIKILIDAQKQGLSLDTILKEKNSILIKNILKNGGKSTKLFLKAFPNFIDYLFRIQPI